MSAENTLSFEVMVFSSQKFALLSEDSVFLPISLGKIPLHLEHVSTLPRELSVYQTYCCS